MIKVTDVDKKKVLMSIIEDMANHNTSVVDITLNSPKFKIKLNIAIIEIEEK